MTEFKEIDGSILEGGGQILRMSIAFSAIMGIPVRVTKIRAGRSKPGLAAQHMKGIQLVGDMCQAKMRGVEIGSTEIEFAPGRIRGGHYVADTQTAGSISLLLQVSLPCALFADGQVTLDLIGGTNAEMAPQIDYLTEVFRPVMEKFGATFDFDLIRRGYYPKGGGHVKVTISPVNSFKNVTMTELGHIEKIYGWSFIAGNLPMKIAYQMRDGAMESLRPLCRDVAIECYKEDRQMAPDNCNGIIVVCETSTGNIFGGDGLGKRGADPVLVGRNAAVGVTGPLGLGACVDSHIQDQMIIFMALADGVSCVRSGELTLHTKTAIYIAESIAKIKFEVTPDDKTNLIKCNGLGFINKYLPPP